DAGKRLRPDATFSSPPSVRTAHAQAVGPWTSTPFGRANPPSRSFSFSIRLSLPARRYPPLGTPAVDAPGDEQEPADERAAAVRDEIDHGVALAVDETRAERVIGRPFEDLPQRADREPERERHDEDPDEVVAFAALPEIGEHVAPGEEDVDDRRDRAGHEEVDDVVVVREPVVEPERVSPPGEGHRHDEGELVRLRQRDEPDGDDRGGREGEVDLGAGARRDVADRGEDERNAERVEAEEETPRVHRVAVPAAGVSHA